MTAPLPAYWAPLPAYWYGDKTLCGDCAEDIGALGHRRVVQPGKWNCDHCHDVIGSPSDAASNADNFF